MTLYLVKHGSDDYRLHREDGTEVGPTWAEQPGPGSIRQAIIDNLSLTSFSDVEILVRFVADIAAGDWKYRDLTIPDETVPWE